MVDYKLMAQHRIFLIHMDGEIQIIGYTLDISNWK